jgi:hypothetical protein
MAIERVSRYYDGPLSQTQHKYTGDYVISVYRAFPDKPEIKYVQHVWQDGDNFATLAEAFKLGPKYWWEILDINPEVLDPFAIVPGTLIRIPYGN